MLAGLSLTAMLLSLPHRCGDYRAFTFFSLLRLISHSHAALHSDRWGGGLKKNGPYRGISERLAPCQGLFTRTRCDLAEEVSLQLGLELSKAHPRPLSAHRLAGTMPACLPRSPPSPPLKQCVRVSLVMTSRRLFRAIKQRVRCMVTVFLF